MLLLLAGCNKWSIDDMWRVIWQVSCGRVIMVTNLVEKGKVICTLHTIEVCEKYIILSLFPYHSY